MNFARAAAVDSRVPTLVLTAEMSIEQMARRLVCEVASVDGKIVRNGDIYNIPSYASEQRRLVSSAARVQKSPIFWRYVKGMAACEVGALIRSHVRKHGVGLVVIDYLQLLEPDHRTGAMTYDIGTVAESLKGFGVKNNVPIICAAQLNRECAKGNRRPQISDIGDSKQIEQAGEVIMLIHRDTEEDPTKAEVNLAKQREGETGVIPMGYVPAWCRFTEEAVVPE
jgi:replicative DNA helicase